MDNESLQDTYARLQSSGIIAPIGECQICDDFRKNKETFFPSHKPFTFCRSYNGGRNHCTCDTCF